MRTRSISALMAATALALAACGGGDDGGSALSEDDLVDELTDICEDAQRDLQRLDDPTEDNYDDVGADAAKVYEDVLEQLRALTPPEDLARDFGDFVDNIAEQLEQAEALADAGDFGEAEDALNEIADLAADQSELAQDLDVEACDPFAGGDEPDDPATTTTEVIAAPTTTVAATLPPTTAPPLTLPATVPPTAPPATAPPATAAPQPAGDLWTVVDLTTIFVAPNGFFLQATNPSDGTLDLIRSLPDLNEQLLEFGVATLVDASDNTEIADIWVGVSRTDAMPADWKDLDCPDGGQLRTSANGLPGIVCFGAADSPTWEIFTATVGDVGISIYTLVPDVPGDLVADAFLAANP